MSNAQAACLKGNSSRISPIALVGAVGRPPQIVNHCHFYTKSARR